MSKKKAARPDAKPAGDRRPKVPAETFRAVLLEGHKGCAVEVPFDPAERWSALAGPLWRGRRGHRVQGTVNGVPFQDAIVPRSRRFWLLVSDHVMADAGVGAGDRVEVTVAPLGDDASARGDRA
jgi:hypothetical protein